MIHGAVDLRLSSTAAQNQLFHRSAGFDGQRAAGFHRPRFPREHHRGFHRQGLYLCAAVRRNAGAAVGIRHLYNRNRGSLSRRQIPAPYQNAAGHRDAAQVNIVLPYAVRQNQVPFNHRALQGNPGLVDHNVPLGKFRVNSSGRTVILYHAVHHLGKFRPGNRLLGFYAVSGALDIPAGNKGLRRLPCPEGYLFPVRKAGQYIPILGAELKAASKHGEHLFPGGWGIRQQPVPIPLENSHPHRLRHIFIVPGIF